MVSYSTYTNDTGHDDWDGTLDHKIRSKDSHCRNAHARLCCSIAVNDGANVDQPSALK